MGSCWRPCAQGSQGGARPEAADIPGPGGARGPVGAGTLHSGCSVRRGSMSRSVGFPASGLQILGFLTSRGPFSSQARQMHVITRLHSSSPWGLHTLAGVWQVPIRFCPHLTPASVFIRFTCFVLTAGVDKWHIANLSQICQLKCTRHVHSLLLHCSHDFWYLHRMRVGQPISHWWTGWASAVTEWAVPRTAHLASV